MTALAYYNEIDPATAQWLRNLIEAGRIAPGFVDERSIEDVAPTELSVYTQCHFFAGIGVWSLALRDAGWPDSRPVWTGSCPCQPFSSAGAGAGFADERHLWPAFHHLIAQCRPPVVFGEQVASKAVGPWIDLVHADLEALGYAFGGVPFPSAGVGAPHIRDRLYWVGHANVAGWEGYAGHGGAAGWEGSSGSTAAPSVPVWLANSEHAGHGGPQSDSAKPGSDGSNLGLLDGGHSALEEQSAAGPTNGFWRAADWLHCRDAKWRPVEPGTFPLADGPAPQLVRLRAYGNALNAKAAQIFIMSAMA